MSPQFLLDTNILSDLVRQPQGRVAKKIAAIGESSICTSIVVAAELRFGARKSGSQALLDRVDLILSAFEVLSLEPPGDDCYALIRHQLERQGTPIGPNDLSIAATAIAMNLTLVTANVGEFSRVEGLKVENWLSSGD